MSDIADTDWLITSTPQGNRHASSEFPLRALPPQSIFTLPPKEWPKPRVEHAGLAARALHTLDILDEEQPSARPAPVPNAPGAAPRAHHRRSHWDLVLIIDTGASMAAWYPTVNAFVISTHRIPLFADIHVVKLHSQGYDPQRPLFDQGALANAGLGTSERRKIVLLISDTVGPAWDAEPLHGHLHDWARHHPVAILHVQPHEDWKRSALRTTSPVVLRSSILGGHNGTFDVRPTDASPLDALDSAPEPADDDTIIPVMELNKRWIEPWCRLLYSSEWIHQQALLVPATHRPKRDTAPPQDLHQRLVDFLGTTLPETARLTTLLAAAPLNRHIMQLIAGLLAPGTGPRHLADILNSGLIQVINTHDPGNAPFDQVVFDFRPDVRAQLFSRQGKGHSDCVDVARIVEDHLARTIPAVQGLTQRIEDLSPPDRTQVTAENLAYLEVERAIFEAQPPGDHNAALKRMSANIDEFKKQPNS
ncbi:SAV_2336 N-terminal domain-related protein [Streptomyces sp. NPDC050264]|uniref:SAV_2336 N-terminal domain-related protein n=1 Tax=Streptomyces sp. NPDC050264 TaxID=3155038 RepID=UPI0034267A59